MIADALIWPVLVIAQVRRGQGPTGSHDNHEGRLRGHFRPCSSCVISSGRTHWSKCSEVRKPNFRAASRAESKLRSFCHAVLSEFAAEADVAARWQEKKRASNEN